MTPARAAALLASLGALLTGLAPAVGDFDAESTAGALGSTAALLLIVREWLKGQRAHEERQDTLIAPALDPASDDIPPSSDLQLLNDGVLEPEDTEGTVTT